MYSGSDKCLCHKLERKQKTLVLKHEDIYIVESLKIKINRITLYINHKSHRELLENALDRSQR